MPVFPEASASPESPESPESAVVSGRRTEPQHIYARIVAWNVAHGLHTGENGQADVWVRPRSSRGSMYSFGSNLFSLHASEYLCVDQTLHRLFVAISMPSRCYI